MAFMGTGIAVRMIACVMLAAVVIGCGGPDAKNGGDANGVDLDGDAYLLLPSEPMVLGVLDAKALYESKSVASQVAQIVERFVPIGEESGFVASRDVDRIVVGMYSTQGADAAAIVRGRFDEGKIAQAAAQHTMTKAGGALSASTYAGRSVYSVAVGSVVGGFVVLTSKTVLAGTESGIRRTLDRVRDGKATKRGMPQWMVDTVETKGAELAFAADFSTQPVASAAIRGLPITFLNGMRMARVLGDFKEPGMHIAATTTYGDPAQANAAAEQLKIVDGWGRALGAVLTFIPKLQNLDVTTDDKDVRAKAAIDEQALHKLLELLPGLIARQ
jgi:hypothetical protein